MNTELRSILVEIEKLRSKLYRAAHHGKVNDPEVIKVSRKLDKKVNTYLQLVLNRRNM